MAEDENERVDFGVDHKVTNQLLAPWMPRDCELNYNRKLEICPSALRQLSNIQSFSLMPSDYRSLFLHQLQLQDSRPTMTPNRHPITPRHSPIPWDKLMRLNYKFLLSPPPLMISTQILIWKVVNHQLPRLLRTCGQSHPPISHMFPRKSPSTFSIAEGSLRHDGDIFGA